MKNSSVFFILNISGNCTFSIKHKLTNLREKTPQKQPNKSSNHQREENRKNVLMQTRKETSEEVGWAVSAPNIL